MRALVPLRIKMPQRYADYVLSAHDAEIVATSYARDRSGLGSKRQLSMAQ